MGLLNNRLDAAKNIRVIECVVDNAHKAGMKGVRTALRKASQNAGPNGVLLRISRVAANGGPGNMGVYVRVSAGYDENALESAYEGVMLTIGTDVARNDQGVAIITDGQLKEWNAGRDLINAMLGFPAAVRGRASQNWDTD